jgi:hypothetical protein
MAATATTDRGFACDRAYFCKQSKTEPATAIAAPKAYYPASTWTLGAAGRRQD